MNNTEYKILTPTGKIETFKDTDIDFKINPAIMHPFTDKVKNLAAKDKHVIHLEQEVAENTKKLADLNKRNALPTSGDLKEFMEFANTHNLDTYLEQAGEYMANIKALNNQRVDVIKKYIVMEQKRIAATYKNDIQTLLDNLFFDIGLYAYHIYQVRHESKMALPKELPAGIRELWEAHKDFDIKDIVMYQDDDVAFTVLEFMKAMSKAETFATYNYENSLHDLLESPHIKYCGIRPYVEFIERESPENGKTLRKWIYASISKATAISEEEKAYIDKWVAVSKRLDKKQEKPLEEVFISGRPQSRVDMMDKLTRLTFENALMNNDTPIKMEKHGSKKEINVFANITMDEKKGIKIVTPTGINNLTSAHQEVYNAVVTQSIAGGNEYMTIPMIEYALTGRYDKKQLREERVNEINDILTLLMTSHIYIDANNEFAAYKYAPGTFRYDGPLLAAERVTRKINGVTTSCIHLLREPVLYTYANAKNQIARYPLKLLDVPMNNNMENISLKGYVIRRIEAMKNKKNKISNVMLYKTIYEKTEQQSGPLGKTPASIKKKKMKIRDKVKIILGYLKESGDIKGFTENKKGREIVSVSIKL